MVKHDLFGKPVSTFPDHALVSRGSPRDRWPGWSGAGSSRHCERDTPLDIRLHSSYVSDNSLTEGACRPACRQVERGAVPAGGIANPHSGGPGAPVDRQKDRSARSALNRRLEASGQNTCELETSGKPGSGAEPRLDAFGLASAAVKRRKAGASHQDAQPRDWRGHW